MSCPQSSQGGGIALWLARALLQCPRETAKPGLKTCPHLRDSHTCTLCSRRICTDISWRCSWSPTLPYPLRDWLQPAKEKTTTKKHAITPRPVVIQHWFEEESPPASFPPNKTFIRVKGAIFTGQILLSAVMLYLSRPCARFDRGPECPCSLRTEEDIVRGPVIKQRLWLVLFLQSIPFSSIKSWMTFPGSVCMTNTHTHTRVTQLILKQSAHCSRAHGWNSLQRCNHDFYHVSLQRDNITRDLRGKILFTAYE